MTVSIVAFAGCVLQPVKPPLVETVAILPFDNETNDISADTIMQTYVYMALKQTSYRVTDIKETNEKLSKAGIVDGGQLPALDPVKIAQDMGVQALMYGYVESFGYKNIGFYVERKVRLGLRLVDGNTGGVLWENTQSIATRKITFDSKEAGDNFAQGMSDQLVDKLFNSPLEEEARGTTVKTLSTLPGFQFNGFGKPESKSSDVKKFINKK